MDIIVYVLFKETRSTLPRSIKSRLFAALSFAKNQKIKKGLLRRYLSLLIHMDSPATLASIPSDIIQSHILSRLDGTSLASFSCASSDFLSLSSDDRLWKAICATSWPSTADNKLTHVIDDFSHGHRSFFSDSYTPISNSCCSAQSSPLTNTKLISAVDVFYKGDPLFSKVLETETVTPWFMSAPFNIDLIEEPVPTPICTYGQKDDTVLKHLQENLTISWIVIDPVAKRSSSICGTRPDSVERHWISGDIRAEFSTAVRVEWKGTSWSSEAVQCRVTVTLGGDGGGLKEVSMRTEDLDGRGVNGEDSLVILVSAIQSGERRKSDVRVSDFGEMKRKRRESQLRRESAVDLICTLCGVAIFVFFCIWLSTLFR